MEMSHSERPFKYYLSGSDRFQYFLDRHHRRYGKIGNISRLALTLNSKPNVLELEKMIMAHLELQWIGRLRLSISSLFRRPYWIETEGEFRMSVHEQPVSSMEKAGNIIFHDINPKKDNPIQLDLIQVANLWTLIYSWNHVVMDARGAELLLSSLESPSDAIFYEKKEEIILSWKERLMKIKKIKNFIIPRVKEGLAVPLLKKNKNNSEYKIIKFSVEETKAIDRMADQYKVGVVQSLMYLAVVKCAFNKTISNQNGVTWVVVPQDRRKKGRQGPIVGNHVSFLFYSSENNVGHWSETIQSLRDQMLDQMRNRLSDHYHVMMDSIRRFPSWLYRHLVAAPTKGYLASFFYSDVGHSLTDLRTVAGAEVIDAMHIPPNSTVPGLTIIFMRFRGQQRIILAFPKENQFKRRFEDFEKEIKTMLLDEK